MRSNFPISGIRDYSAGQVIVFEFFCINTSECFITFDVSDPKLKFSRCHITHGCTLLEQLRGHYVPQPIFNRLSRSCTFHFPEGSFLNSFGREKTTFTSHKAFRVGLMISEDYKGVVSDVVMHSESPDWGLVADVVEFTTLRQFASTTTNTLLPIQWQRVQALWVKYPGVVYVDGESHDVKFGRNTNINGDYTKILPFYCAEDDNHPAELQFAVEIHCVYNLKQSFLSA